MSKTGKSGLGCGVALLLSACVLLGLVGTVFFVVPKLVEQTYGLPSEQLGVVQRLNAELQLLTAQDDLLKPYDPAGGEQKFTIRMGETANSVAARMEESGLIRSGESFRIYLVYSGMDTGIQAGEYTLSPKIAPVELAKALQDATPQELDFNILAGWRVEEIARALPSSGLAVSPDGFLEVVAHPPATVLPEGWKISGGLEGMLLPGSYHFPRNARSDDLVRAFVSQFNTAVTSEMRDAYAKQGLSLQQAVTLASIIQREAMVDEEQPLIASVFYNRLAAGMKLESDPTVQYAVGYNGTQQTWWTNPLSSEDLHIDSPYNTYQNTGLPPGPISNPSLSALKAVAYPAQTPYFYFRAACDHSGRHHFSKTYAEHLQNACP